ncbi:CarboxypepD_reg-like domain-containing protein [Robiginitalea myxolifaciens]|uniref:CarboxypepD_reg-like domain-containing protein n=1 Tax=Robiginitalea myxolifaciens TaxID=400055 RepID=A0A1I6G0L7_9FLAO|nr:carboxypeptidase-like regulatory domain-containing protein [Robiginitalea myxolifaciens]SFR35735.1 CarboxypepD_reg-like domain-containing protein [Robiginitalea myxolifaciens]
MSYQIKIAEPCSEDWNQMTPTQQGAFCASCKKEVVDFTGMSNRELARRINEAEKDKQGEGLCGRFRSSQLDTPLPRIEANRWRQNAIAAGFTAVMGFSGSLKAQESLPKVTTEIQPVCDVEDTEIKTPFDQAEVTETEELQGVLGGVVIGGAQAVGVDITTAEIRGVVLDQDQQPLPGARVTIVGTDLLAHTNFDGEYVLRVSPRLRTDDMWLEISYIGFVSKTVLLSKSQSASEIMLVELEEDFMGEMVVVGGASFGRPSIFRRIGNLFRRRAY